MKSFLKWFNEENEGLSFSFTPMKAEKSNEPKLNPRVEKELNKAVLALTPTIPGVPFGNLKRRQSSQYSGMTYETNLDDILKTYVDMIHDLNKDVKMKTGKQSLLLNYLSADTPEDYMNKIENKVAELGKGYLQAFQRIQKYHKLFVDIKNKHGDKAAQINVTINKHRPEDEPFVEQKKNPSSF